MTVSLRLSSLKNIILGTLHVCLLFMLPVWWWKNGLFIWCIVFFDFTMHCLIFKEFFSHIQHMLYCCCDIRCTFNTADTRKWQTLPFKDSLYVSLQIELRKQASQWVDSYLRYIKLMSNKLGKYNVREFKLVRVCVISHSYFFMHCQATSNTNENWGETIHWVLCNRASSSFELLSICLPFWS